MGSSSYLEPTEYKPIYSFYNLIYPATFWCDHLNLPHLQQKGKNEGCSFGLDDSLDDHCRGGMGKWRRFMGWGPGFNGLWASICPNQRSSVVGRANESMHSFAFEVKPE